MSRPDREGQILNAVVSLVDSLLDDVDVIELLTQLTERCTQLLDIASAGLLLADPQRQLHLMAATSNKTRELEVFQIQNDEGPCLDCFAEGRQISVADLRSETARWPRFVNAAIEAGFASVQAVPLRAAGMVLGALGLFGTQVGQLNPQDVTVGQTLAHIATVAILQDRPAGPATVLPRLQATLTSRIVVEQAKGFLRGSLGVSIDEAFSLLRGYAHAQEMHISQLAESLVSDRRARPEILEGISRLAAEPGRLPPGAGH